MLFWGFARGTPTVKLIVDGVKFSSWKWFHDKSSASLCSLYKWEARSTCHVLVSVGCGVVGVERWLAGCPLLSFAWQLAFYSRILLKDRVVFVFLGAFLMVTFWCYLGMCCFCALCVVLFLGSLALLMWGSCCVFVMHLYFWG